MTHCPNFTGVLSNIKDDGNHQVLVARCKSWYCQYCADLNRKRWMAVLLNHVFDSRVGGVNWSWFTLTANSNAHASEDTQASLRNISQSWGKLMKRLRRKYGKFEYCRVYEKHKSGHYHLHCMAGFWWDDLVARNKGKKSEYSDSRWLKATAKKLGMGYMTHAANIEGDKAGQVVSYVVKYMTKIEDCDRESWGRVRRIQTSRGIHYVTPSADTWQMKSSLYLPDLAQSLTEHYEIILLNEDSRILSFDDFLSSPYYPPD